MPIEVVVGHPYSDIGKGWITSSVATQMGKPMIFKVDQVLEESTPPELGVLVNGTYVTPDAGTYMRRGHRFSPDQHINMGGFLLQTLQKQPFREGVTHGEVAPPLTIADVSAYLAADIARKMETANTDSAVIEVGGSSDDPEAKAIPGAIRLLSQKYETGLILVTKFDSNDCEGELNIKTRVPVRAIEETMREYWGVPLHAAFVRRATVSGEIDDDQLGKATRKIAFKTQQDPHKIIYLPNVKRVEDLDNYTGIFGRRSQRQLPQGR